MEGGRREVSVLVMFVILEELCSMCGNEIMESVQVDAVWRAEIQCCM